MLKSFLTLASGEIVARGFQAVAMVLLTRAAGMEAIGQFGVASSIAAYALLLVNQGFDPIAVRATMQGTIQLQSAMEEIMGLRALLALVVTIGTGAVVWTRTTNPVAQLLLILCGTFLSSALTPRWVFLAQSRSRPLAVAGVISQGCFLAGVLMVRVPGEIHLAAWAQVVGEGASAGFLWLAAGRPVPRWSLRFSRWLLSDSWPVTLSVVMGTAFYNFDLLALAGYGRWAEVGPYLSSYRCLTIFAPLLGALQNSILPHFSASWPDLGAIRRKVALLTFAVSSVLGVAAVLLFAFASTVLHLLYGRDIGAAPALLRVLAWVLPVQGARAVMRQVLLGFKLQRVDTRIVTAGILTNIALDLILIPAWGALGCAYSTLAAESVFLVGTAIGIRNQRLQWESSNRL